MVSALVPDTGRYVCVAENVAGSSEKQFNLNVHGKSLENPLYRFFFFLQLFRDRLRLPRGPERDGLEDK